ncbi:glycosyltransferase, partial [uncultured Treponema sp.]|uniref:glycosyltransferase n=1 Tax=uncultured Treponema sp. TaxID=162155 RepID=UPI0025CBA355
AKRDMTFRSKLLIVGNAENFRTGDQETIKKIQSLQQENHDGEIKIEFTGKISNERLKYLYAESRYLVQPSLYEGFGIPPLEAMTVGTPAIISDIPVFKEIYSTFPVSFFKAGNASDLAEKIIEMNKSVTDSFSLDKICDVYSYERSAKIICDTMLNFKN